jgi:hypothetical protein
MANIEDIEIYAGDTKSIVLTVLNTDGSAKDLTDASIIWVIFDENTEEVLVEKDETEMTPIDIPNGIIGITLLSADTENIRPAPWYRHECEVTDIGGNVSTVVVGNFTIMESIV